MTAIIIGRIPKANFIVVDAMVQLSLKVNSFKECRVQDKITDIELSEQYLVLAGEQLIADGANMLHNWSLIKKIKYDLFETSNFEIVLEFGLRYRKYHKDIAKSPIIEQATTDVYVASRKGIKYYAVGFEDGKYVIKQEEEIADNYIVINYKGNIKRIPTPSHDINVYEFSKQELEKEHRYRKVEGFKIGQLPLGYDFDDRFSAAILPTDIDLPVQREYPFKAPTDIFLSWGTDWEYVADPEFCYIPPTL